MQRAADRARHRDMARNHQVERQAGDLEFDQRRIDCVARADQRADQIVGRLAFAAPDRVDEIVQQGDGAARMHKPLFQRTLLLHQDPVIVPDVQLRIRRDRDYMVRGATYLLSWIPSVQLGRQSKSAPETSTGFDVGFEQPLLHDQVAFGATYFHNDITDLICRHIRSGYLHLVLCKCWSGHHPRR